MRRKNLRRIGGLPLFAHTVAAVESSRAAARLVLSTDDPLVITWAELHDVEVLVRAPELCADETTLAEVAAAVAAELSWEGTVGVFQPTSPLRSAASINRALEEYRETGASSLMSVVRENHLYWFDEGDGIPKPLFGARVNRQFATHRVLRETGAIQLVDAAWLATEGTMVSDRHRLFELPAEEGLDIDTSDDLAVARRRTERGLVVLRLTANQLVGGGHLYHGLELAEELDDHDLIFLLKECDDFVGELLSSRGFDYRTEVDLGADLAELLDDRPAVLVNDVLDTSVDDVVVPRQLGLRVVNIEDLGPGAHYADWVINALYPVREGAPSNMASGVAYASLRPEFRDHGPQAVREQANRVLVTFGTTDPTSTTRRVATLLAAEPGVEVTAVLGAGAPDVELPPEVTVKRHVPNMAAEMAGADVIVTAAGRSVYEAASLGIPVVVLAQNAREATHCHISYESGVVFLGIAPLVTDQRIVESVTLLLKDAELRRELSGRLTASIDGRGTERIANGINRLLRGLEI